MQPIISPWVFYLISLSHNLKTYASILALVFAFLFFGLFLVYKTAAREDLSAGEAGGLNAVGRYSRLSGIFALVFGSLALVLPSAITGMQMLIASYATERNVLAVVEFSEQLKGLDKDKIVRAINEIEKKIQDNEKIEKEVEGSGYKE